MTIFNPDVAPGRDDMPNYFRYSSPISGVEADKSSGLAFATAGQGLEGIAAAGEKAVKESIGEDVRKTVEPIRENFANDLEAVRAAQVAQNTIPNAVQTAGGAKGPQLLNEEQPKQPIPMAIDNGLAKVQSLQSALASGKGVNDTYYDLNLKSAVTQLRARYPGYVDYIDEKVSSITGINPANAYVNNLMQDINKATSNKKTEDDKILDLARGAMSKGFNQAANMYDRLESDPSFKHEFLRWYTQENARDTQTSRNQADLNLKKARGEDTARDATRNLTDYIGSKIDSDLNATLTLSGTNKPETIRDILTKAKNDPAGAYTGVQMEEFATKLQAHRDMLRSQLVLLTNQNGFTREVGVQARDAELDSQMKYYDTLYNSVRGGGAGGAGYAFVQMNMARAALDQSRYNLTKGNLGELTNNFQILSEKLGPGLTGTILVPALLSEQGKLPDKLKAVFAEKFLEAHAQPGGEANPTTLAQHMSEVANDTRITKEEKAYVYKGLTNTVEELKDPRLPDDSKAGAVRYLFDPKNNSMLSNWKMDYTTPSPDRKSVIVHPGKYTIWTQLTDKEVTNSIAKLDEKSKNYYRTWVDITGRELIGEDVRNLNHFTGHDNLSFEWGRTDNGVPKLILKDREGGLAPPTYTPGSPYSPPSAYVGGPQAPPSKGYIFQVQQVVDRINKALPNLEHVYKSMGNGNTEVMLLQTLQQYGMDFNGKISGLPKAFGDAIAASRKKPEEKK